MPQLIYHSCFTGYLERLNSNIHGNVPIPLLIALLEKSIQPLQATINEHLGYELYIKAIKDEAPENNAFYLNAHLTCRKQ